MNHHRPHPKSQVEELREATYGNYGHLFCIWRPKRIATDTNKAVDSITSNGKMKTWKEKTNE